MLRPLLLALLGASLALGCSNSQFASGGAAAGAKKPAKKTTSDNGPDGDDPESGTGTGTDTSTDGSGDTDLDDDGGSLDVDDGNAKKDGGDLGEEEDYIKKLPGVAVTKVGVNFEDIPVGGDADFNDAVMCFSGKFKVEGSNVVSTAKQTVTASTFSSSGCKHNVRAEVVHKDGSKEPPVTFDSRAPAPVTLKFKVGSKLEVFMKPYDGCNEGRERNMHTAQDAQVKPDLCNNH